MREYHPNVVPLPAREDIVDAYHGTTKEYALQVIKSKKFHKSINPGDWLGNGIYFWENNPGRAKMWAIEKAGDEEGAVVLKTKVRLGKCLDLSDSSMASIISVAYDHLKDYYKFTGQPLPKNNPNDKIGHYLDCKVMNYLPKIVEVDTIRAPFYEGEELFPGSFLLNRSHIQIVVINERNIVGEISIFS